MWDIRYNTNDYIYGTSPNSYLVEVSKRIPKGQVLSLGEGEGWNAVYLAAQGYTVTAVDSSAVGLEKARRLALDHSTSITTVVADLDQLSIEPGTWDGIVPIFCHLPSRLRAAVHGKVVAGLRLGGVFVLEAYTPRQLMFKTGGPSQIDLLVDLASLKDELTGLRLEQAVEIERDIFEGQGHYGRGTVVQILGFKEA